MTHCAPRRSIPPSIARGRPISVLLAPGAEADLLLLGSNPLDDIHHLRDLRSVVLAGVWYGPEQLRSMTDDVHALWTGIDSE